MFILAILVICGIRGWTKGLILSFFNVVGFIGAAVIANRYHPRVTEYIIQHSNLFLKIQHWLETRLKGIAMNREGIAGNIIMNENFFHYRSMSDVFARMLIEMISMILIFLIVKFLLVRVGRIVDRIFTLPILNQFNRLGGMVFGLCKGLLWVFILLTILTPFMTMMNEGILIGELERSVVTKYLYNHNPIMGMVRGIFEVPL